jgi:hypothetical protein
VEDSERLAAHVAGAGSGEAGPSGQIRLDGSGHLSLASLGLSDAGLGLDYKAAYLVEQSVGGVGE